MSELNPVAALATLRMPAQADIVTPAERALKMAEGWSITDDETYALAADELTAIKSKQKALEDMRTSITGPMNQALKAVNAVFKSPAELLERAERLIKGHMIAYADKREAERRAAELAARRAAEEAERLAAEEHARAAKEAGQGDMFDDAPSAESAAADAAIMAIASAPVAPPVLKAAGVSKVKVTMKAEVFDKAAFIAHIAQAPAYLDLVDINATKLNQLAKALGSNLNMPGVKLVEEKSIAARAA